MKCAKSVFVVLGFALLSPAPFPHLIPALLPVAHAQEQLWIRQFGTSQWEGARALAPDGAGGVMVAGYTSGSLSGPNAGPVLSTDVFLARYDDAGERIWIHQFGTTGYDHAKALVSVGAGGVIVAGYTPGSLGGPNAGLGDDVFLSRYDGNGKRLWISQFGSITADQAFALALDGAGGVMVAGSTHGSLGAPNAGSWDALLARYDLAGNQLWIRQFGTRSSDYAYALAPDGAGGVMIAGTTLGSLGSPNPSVDFDVFLARYDVAGNQLWLRQFGTNTGDVAVALASDSMGGVFIAGFTTGSLGGPSAGEIDAFLARYDGAGNRLWITQFGTSTPDFINALAPDGAGGVMVAGVTNGNLGGPNAGPVLTMDAFLARYDGAGNQFWIRQFGSSRYDWLGSIIHDGAGGVMVAGETRGSLGGPSAGMIDVFLARFTDGSCYADCDPTTGIGVLDMRDFLCFQDSFVSGEPYACDCDTSTGVGVCDVFDFLCFQDAFVGGCS